jgi:hypothetical protein
MEKQLSELRALCAHAENRRTETGIPRVAMVRGSVPEHELSAVYEPMINLILEGSKSMTVGGRTLHYNPASYFVMSVDLPAAGVVLPACQEEPKFPQLWESKIPHLIQASASSGRTRPALSFSFRR